MKGKRVKDVHGLQGDQLGRVTVVIVGERLTTSTYILGVSAYYHDSAACLIRDGEIVAAVQEERFTRKKFDSSFPTKAIRYCLQQGGISLADLKYFVFYDKPLIKFERLLETYVAFSPRGIKSFLAAMPVWLKEKLLLKNVLQHELVSLGGIKGTELPVVLFGEHHESHAASAFYPSPFMSSAVLCIDGVGEWATTSAWMGHGNDIKPLWEIHFPHSLGLLYSAFTYYTGFKVNSGEYKVMGLAPYGKPKYVKAIYDHLIDLKQDGTFRLNMDYFNYCTGLTMTNGKFDDLFGGPRRKPETLLTQRDMDIARSVQEVTEEVMLRLAKSLQRETGAENLCMAGGVALNCVSNGRILREGPFKRLWIQPSAGDAGGAIGAALTAWHKLEGKERKLNDETDSMRASLLGPSYSNAEIEELLKKKEAPYVRLNDDILFDRVASELADGKVVGYFQGRMEFGPRALGARSILGDARNPKMQSIMNLKVKYRESFRPFAPSVLRERVSDYFEMDTDSPYMLLVAPVVEKRRTQLTEEEKSLWGIALLNVPKSDIPAATHLDYSARVQTVRKETNPRYHKLLKAFERKTGCGLLVNTSFNVRNEPIVCTPEDAYRCFMRTAIDILVLENCLLYKTDQKLLESYDNWQREFEMD
jgi:carbamoyltransferase